MPWVIAKLRSQNVYARADAEGRLVVEGGRVEVRYKPSDGRRYGARADNLVIVDPTPLPDDTCAPADAVAAPAKDKATKKKAAASSIAPVPEGAIVVYADGACSGNPGPAGLGVVIVDGKVRIELSEYLGVGTNNIGELTAILRALEAVAPERPAVIHTDSQYSIGVLQKGWKAKANVELIAKIKQTLKGRKATSFVYVPGHAGVLLNERADALAREAVERRASRREVLTSKPEGP